ncbi:MAG: DUF5050 domain-containing protein [Oscillospiraceae bacterium]|nr:DUF5050 domain-containing protein [Oscillospiraceae bacterium]
MIKKISIILTVLILFCGTMGIKCSAYENEWIYYSNTNDVGRLYKIKKDGSGMKRLSMQTAYDIEVLGEWVYYFNNSQKGGAFRTKTDGSETEKLIDGFEHECYGVYKDRGHIYIPYIEGNKISYGEPKEYYCSNVLIYGENGRISEITIDDQISDDQLARCVEAVNDCIIFSRREKRSDDDTYYSLKLNFDDGYANVQDTVELKALPSGVLIKSKGKGCCRSDTDFYRDKYLCWNEVKGAEKYIVYRIDPQSGKYKKLAETDGTDINITVANSEYNGKYTVTAVKTVNNAAKQYKAKMLDSKAYDFSSESFAAGYKDTYYYCEDDGIYCGSKKISSRDTDGLCIANEKLYIDSADGIYRMNMDGTEETLIFSGDERYIISIAAFDGKLLICYTNYSEAYDVHTVIMDPDDGKTVEINNIVMVYICAVNNKIIYRGGDGLIYSMKRDGSDICCISENSAKGVYVYNGKVYFCNDKGIFSMNYDGTEVGKIYETNAIDIAVCNDRIYFVEMHIEKLSPIEYHAFGIDLDGGNLTAYMSGHDNIQAVEAYGEYIFLYEYASGSYVCHVLDNA